MLQTVLQDGNYGFFTQAALVLFFGSFLVVLLTTFARPRSQTDRYSRMPLAEDRSAEPTASDLTDSDHGDKPS
jgi:hypothetical protein